MQYLNLYFDFLSRKYWNIEKDCGNCILFMFWAINSPNFSFDKSVNLWKDKLFVLFAILLELINWLTDCRGLTDWKLHLFMFFPWHRTLYAHAFWLYLCMSRTLFVNWLNNNNEPQLWFGQCVYLSVTKVKVRKYYSFLGLSWSKKNTKGQHLCEPDLETEVYLK